MEPEFLDIGTALYEHEHGLHIEPWALCDERVLEVRAFPEPIKVLEVRDVSNLART